MDERVLVLGGDGLLGHNLCRVLSPSMETFATVRGSSFDYTDLNLVPPNNLVGWIDVKNMEYIQSVISMVKPTVVLNAIGAVKQRESGRQWAPAITLNALLPHQIWDFCEPRGIRLIHFSTDCVFSGKLGSYKETDVPDPEDVYGKTKMLGEVSGNHALTLRTSIIGWELRNFKNLLSWFAGQRGKAIEGFVGAIFTGLPAGVLAELVRDLITDFPDLSGIYHVSSDPISKHELLTMLRDSMGWDIQIQKNIEFFCDRSLDDSRFRETTKMKAPGWKELIAHLAADWERYEKFYD